MTDKARRPVFYICLALALGTFILYARAATYNFIIYDDLTYVLKNTAIQNGPNAQAIAWAFTSGYASNWHPLTWISHMIDWALYGSKHPGGHHLTNVFFHIANTLLLFLALKKMTGALWRSAAVAALFAWHPLHVESVAWVAERKDVLSTLFWLLALLAYARYARESKVNGTKRNLYYGLTLFWFALGLMSKPMLVTLPFVLLLLDYWPLQRVSLEAAQTRPTTWPRLVLEKIPFFLLSLVSSVVTFQVQKNGGAVMNLQSLSFMRRVFNALEAYAGYIEKMFWPSRLAILYPLNNFAQGPAVWSSAFLLITLTILVIWGHRQKPWLLFGWLWFLGTLVPVIGLVQVGAQSMADRYSYMPFVGLFIILSWGTSFLLERMGKVNWSWGIAIPVLLVCWSISWRQISYWKNSETLFRHAVAVTHNNIIAHIDLGRVLDDENRPAEAKEEFLAALKIEPDSPMALNDMGVYLAHQGDITNAIGLYQSAIRNQPFLEDAHYNLGNVLAGEGKLEEAAAEYREALRIKPNAPDARNNLGAVLLRMGKYPEALAEFKSALRERPNFIEAQFQLGNTYLKLRQLDQAKLHFAEAARLKPDFAAAQFKLGFVLAQLDFLPEALAHFHAALRLEPENANTWFNLGAAEEALQHTNEARAAFKEVLRLKPGDADAQARLTALDAPPKK